METAAFFTADAFLISFVYKEAEGKYSKVRGWDARAQPKECILALNSILCHQRQSKAVFITVSYIKITPPRASFYHFRNDLPQTY